MAKGESKRFEGTRGNPQRKLPLNSHNAKNRNNFPSNDAQIKHIFANREGHLPDTPINRKMILDLANNVDYKIGVDKFNNEWYTRTGKNGEQLWVCVRYGIIQNCGQNIVPRAWDSETGLCVNRHKKNKFKEGKKDDC